MIDDDWPSISMMIAIIGTKHEIRQYASGTKNHRVPQPHHVARCEDEPYSIEPEHHPRPVRHCLHRRNELKIERLFPHLEGDDEKSYAAAIPAACGGRLAVERWYAAPAQTP